jgi:oligopeptide transport system permease protein
LPLSLALAFLSLCTAAVVSVGFAALWYLSRASGFRVFLLWLSVFMTSLPGFLAGALLIYLFSLRLKLFPPALLETKMSWVLPVFSLAIRPAGLLSLLLVSELKQHLQSDYIRSAVSKGASEIRIFFFHLLKNILVPWFAAVGNIAGSLIVGSFAIENLYSIPGIGIHFVNSVLDRDYFLLAGLTVIYCAIVIGIQTAVDIILAAVDPRMTKDILL